MALTLIFYFIFVSFAIGFTLIMFKFIYMAWCAVFDWINHI